ncbi:hypothetical protein [Frigidibacter sp. ROC022]|uniref:hypothetical protein n=1 Tax=Frigidibacter sp. ROC022 TaxID=2971796 RepID=UPI00215AEE67|nr:hypothetical protein [Frigidibacter sp. ROC022]MCR8724000.1 hypothetical protein [Frigidibacter sp. ROC022]
MRRFLFLLLTLLAACTRPLAPPEAAFLRNFTGDRLDTSAIRIHPGLVTLTRRFPVQPRLTCQSRLYPPNPNKTALGAAPAMTLWNTIMVRSDWAAKDLTGGVPRQMDLVRAMLLAHEAVHVWQWQHRAETGYTPWRAAREHVTSADPYLFDPDTTADFSSFGYEQQGAIVEEYLCCRVLAPNAERTRRLHEMLAKVFPVSPISTPLAQQVLLPWRGVQIEGICD